MDVSIDDLVRLHDSTGSLQRVALELDGGYEGTVEVMFVFDTVDNQENNYEGWYIDNLRVDQVNIASDANVSSVAGAAVVAAAGVGEAVDGHTNGTLIVTTATQTFSASLADLTLAVVQNDGADITGSRIVALGDITNDGEVEFAINGVNNNYLLRHDGANWEIVGDSRGRATLRLVMLMEMASAT